MLFSGGVVRVYAIALTVGPAGFLAPLFALLDISPNSILLLEASIVIGLLNFTIPIVTITLLSAIKNIDTSLEEAAQTLGASRWQAFFDTTLRLSFPGIMSAAILSFAICVSAFVVPMILGRGIVVFATNLIFSRFAEVTNHPSGAAIAMVLLAIAVIIIYVFIHFAGTRRSAAGAASGVR
jgi:ABC-type spermidine/putrescine transport system permease subunit I